MAQKPQIKVPWKLLWGIWSFLDVTQGFVKGPGGPWRSVEQRIIIYGSLCLDTKPRVLHQRYVHPLRCMIFICGQICFIWTCGSSGKFRKKLIFLANKYFKTGHFLPRHCSTKYRKTCLAKVEYTYQLQQNWYLKNKNHTKWHTIISDEYNLFYTNAILALGFDTSECKVCLATKQRESHLRAQIHSKTQWISIKRNFLHWHGNVDKYEVNKQFKILNICTS